MSKLLRDALLDAKAVKELARKNAKQTLDETFSPRIQQLVAEKLDDDDDEMETDLNDVESAESDEDGDVNINFFENDDDEMEDTEMEDDDDASDIMPESYNEFDDELDDDLYEEFDDDLNEEFDDELYEEFDDELDDDLNEEFDNEFDDDLNEEFDDSDDDLYEEFDNEFDDDLNEEFDDDSDFMAARRNTFRSRKTVSENIRLKNKLAESLRVVHKLRNTINEVNLLNAKLMYLTKMTSAFDLTRSQKTSILDRIDDAKNVREAKIIYQAIRESYNKVNTSKLKNKNIKKNFVNPKQSVQIGNKTLKESFDFVPRWKKLANL